MRTFLLLFLYSSGWLLAAGRLAQLARTRHESGTRDMLLLWIVFLVPLGKLIYFHVEALMGFKFVFLFFTMFAAATLLPRAFDRTRPQYVLGFCALLAFPALSLVLKGDLGAVFLYELDGQKDSLGARLASLGILIVFAAFVCDFAIRRGVQPLLEQFVAGVVCASLVGVVIFVAVYGGVIDVDDLLPISADTHVIDFVYRFNPGANVNEFGVIAAYGLFLAGALAGPRPLVRRAAVVVLLLFALFFSLTRAAWLGFVAGIFVVGLFDSRYRLRVLLLAVLTVLFVTAIYYFNETFASLVTSRLEFDPGASGEERIEKFEAAFADPFAAPLTLLFGNGWATNLYLHSVPLQLLYEAGVAGFLVFLVAYFYLLGGVVRRRRAMPPALFSALAGCAVVLAVAASFHHTLYHMQTWFVVGLLMAATARPVPKTNENRDPRPHANPAHIG